MQCLKEEQGAHQGECLSEADCDGTAVRNHGIGVHGCVRSAGVQERDRRCIIVGIEEVLGAIMRIMFIFC